MEDFSENREFMKSKVRVSEDYKRNSDITVGVPQPLIQEKSQDHAILVDLPMISVENAPKADFFSCTYRRQSRRNYTEKEMSLYDLAYMLYCTQGIKEVIGGYKRYLTDGSGKNYLRLVASSGYAYDTYLAINHVESLLCGIWKYLPLTHQLEFCRKNDHLPEELDHIFSNPSQNQSYTMKAAVVFFWVCIPYRSEWIQGEAAHKLMLIDVGYISHQLYLASESINYGCCAIAGYHQEEADQFLGVDGKDEFTVLCSSVGHV